MNRLQADMQSILSQKQLFEPLRHSAVLITGATGLIGSMAVRTLLAANESYNLDIRIVGQIRNPEKANRLFNGLMDRVEWTADDHVPCAYVIHTVSPTASKFFIEHPVETIRTSVESTMSIRCFTSPQRME